MIHKFQGIDRQFNAAVMTIANGCNPRGWVVGDRAPETLDEINLHMATGQPIKVWSGASDNTIYGDREINYAFRAWHDWVHYTYQYELTSQGEFNAAKMQCSMLLDRYGESATTMYWCELIMADVMGQGEYYRTHNKFPSNQLAFVKHYLVNPMGAVGRQEQGDA